MADAQVQTPAGEIRAALEIPTGTGPWPGVVVLHDAIGFGDDIRGIARRIADAGFLALAPDLYSRGGALRCTRTVFRDLIRREGRTVDDIVAAREHLAARPDCNGKVAVAGFCLGGGFALIVSPKGFDAAAPFYPSLPSSFEKVVDGACPIVASFGSRDPINIGGEKKLRAALDARGIEHDLETYDGAGHGFANKLPGEQFTRIVGFGYDEQATEQAWSRVFAFFGTHLN
ncbi:dienelactone hydrolase family protein [Aldersonia kunmingensis]|uniref:dienelactone hydrolase family protein n=1 Tax=Aldersonia kunmingensis TaxID=408066 RepID=UPI00082C74FF|nr:dienelactone hydrolase family protein [Aldersonia kunmingensis]